MDLKNKKKKKKKKVFTFNAATFISFHGAAMNHVPIFIREIVNR